MDGHSFCFGCVKKLKNKKEKCPGLRDDGSKCNKVFVKTPIPVELLRKEIEKAEMMCYTCADENVKPISSNADGGNEQNAKKPKLDRCPWTGTVKEAEEHFAVCDYAGVSCPHDGCGAVVARRDQHAHRESCVHRLLSCKWGCYHRAKRWQLDRHEAHDCARRAVECPNKAKGCSAQGLRFNTVGAHREQCGYEEVPCPFIGVGCVARVLRKDVEAHERDATAMVQHNRLMLANMVRVEARADKRSKDLEAEIQELKDEAERRAEGLEGDIQELKEKVEQQEEVIDEQKERIDELHTALDHTAANEVIVLKIEHAQLTSKSGPDNFKSDDKMVAGRTFYLRVKTKSSDAPDHYGIYLNLKEGAVPCKVKYAFELVHHDDDEDSKKQKNSEHTFERIKGWGFRDFIAKDELTKTSPYIKDGMVTFKCTFEVVA